MLDLLSQIKLLTNMETKPNCVVSSL